MSIFRRGKKPDIDVHSEGERSENEPDRTEGERTEGERSENEPDRTEVERSENEVDLTEVDQNGAGSSGPFDAADVDLSEDDRLDLGALRVRGVPGMELRLEVDETAQQVVAATAVIGDSAVQLQAFAAPRTAGIWDGIRAEIAESIVAQGGTADEAHGELGPELRTRMPSAGPDGRTVFAPARFAGIDGPRWFLRAVFSGRAAIDAEAAGPLMAVVRDTVVVRGDAAMAPREMLVLTLPQQSAAADEEAPDAEAPTRVDDLKPFERGPEITEVR